ncbi:MAG: hypothetical protein II820_00215 [Ruminiclostridium sp.]|nr:hypothetical protein [Ruminiclostridium sp.]
MEYRVNNLIYAADKDLHGTIRTGIVLTEPVHAGALRKAADLAIKRYPYFSVKLVRRGEEYVMIHNDAPLPVTPGGRAIPLGGPESNGHLFALAYDNKRLYIDTSHFVTDGNGKFPFIKTLLYCYLNIIHPDAKFETSDIAMPESGVPDYESDDYPFPEKPVHTKPLGSDRRAENVLMLDDQPKGYESIDKWTCFRVHVSQKDMMKYASSVDGSPATFIATIMYRAISDLHPDSSLPIVCGMQHQYRKALGKPFSHLCHVNIVPITYTDSMRGKDTELLNTMARGTIILRADNANDLLSVNSHIENDQKIKELTLAEKHDYMKNFLLDKIGMNTFEVSYTGCVPFSGLDKYITDFFPILDMSLSGGISIEIFPVGENFSINIMQRTDDSKYAFRFIELLMEKGIKCLYETQEHFEINDFVLPE